MRVFAGVAVLFLLALCVDAGITDCAPGYRFDRMSGVGCVQDKCREVPHAFYNYVGYCVCSACGEVGCSGDKGFEKECRRAADDKSCPSCVYACINPKDKCPGEKDAAVASSAQTATTLSAVQNPTSTSLAVKSNENNTPVKVKGRMMAFGKPLRFIRMYCGDGRVEVTTDGNGEFEFEAEGGAVGENYSCEIRFEYVRNDRTYFQIHATDDMGVQNLVHSFELKEGGVSEDMDMVKLLAEDSEGGEALAAIYTHMSEALEFYIDGLKEDLDFQLPLHVHAFMPDDPEKSRAEYNGDNGVSSINIQTRDSIQGSPDRQIMLYHEFSHYVMQALYGKWPYPEGEMPVKERNHGGLLNPSTSDTYVEAFATFMSVVMLKNYGDSDTSGLDPSKMSVRELIAVYGNAQISDLEEDHTAWEKNGRMEEVAGAGILWDLVDGEDDYHTLTPEQMYANYLEWKKDREEFNEYTRREYPEETLLPVPEYTLEDMRTAKLDDDRVELDFQKDVWPVLRTYHSDFSDVYADIVKKRPDQKKGIDEVFVKHGFFRDDQRGNGAYDEFEPFDDVNKNGVRDEGEYFVDLSSETPQYRPNQTIGAPANYQRLTRHSPLEVPGQYIKVGNEVPYYRVGVFYPNKPQLTHTYRTRNINGKIYIRVPPAGYNATILIAAEGVTTGSPLVFTSEKFNRDYPQSAERGYFVEHDFNVSGEIPPQPAEPKLHGSLISSTAKVPGWMWIAVAGGTAATIGLIVCAAVAFILILAAVKYVSRRKT
ncbi:Uncharacterised protein [uncultured archaeon]|nr:Uncharacterised protein [uncultured archaeon]